uniref:Thioredoxin domain-containing protein n=1 Tax=Caenorhabditis japonica TaxID=281687 RepID=A0A8R1HRN8_CAEJA
MALLIKFLLFLSLFVLNEAINPPTAVLDLSEKFLDVKDEGMWFVEFYAPWCAHCKRLHPVWDQVGHALADSDLPIRVGKVDCTRFTLVANKLGIQGYPTIIFFRNGHTIDYRGGRDKESLISFAKRCAAPIIESVKENELEKLKLSARTQPSFVFFGESTGPLFDAFNEAANSKFSVARFYSIAPKDASFRPRVVVLKDNAEVEFNQKDISDLTNWVARERWPGFVQASSSNLAEIGASGKLVVLVVSSETQKFNTTSPIHHFHKIAEEASKEIRKMPEVWDRFQFAWLDGPDLASQIQMATVSEPHLFIFNYTSYEYYLSEDEPSQMTVKSIVTLLKQNAESIDKGTVIALGVPGRHLLTRVKRMAFELYWNVAQMFATQPLLSSCLFGVPIAFLSIICYSICSADFTVDRDEFYGEDEEEEEELIDEEEGEETDHVDTEDDHEKAD